MRCNNCMAKLKTYVISATSTLCLQYRKFIIVVKLQALSCLTNC